MANLFTIDGNGVIEATQPFIAKCGCSSANIAITKVLKTADINPGTIMQLQLSGNKTAQTYLREYGYYEAQPSLSTGTHCVLVHPEKGVSVNLMEKGVPVEEIAADVKEVLS